MLPFRRLKSIGNASLGRIQQFSRSRFNLSGGNADKFVLGSIVLGNAGVFVGWQLAESNYSMRRWMMENFTVSTSGIFDHHRYHTLVTSMYSHRDLWHLLFNMFALTSFGGSAVAVLGAGRFLALYLGSGVFSSLCQAVWPLVIPRNWPARYNYSSHSVGLGASGAINAIVMYSIVMVPATTVLLFGIVPMPGSLFGLGFVGMDLYSLYSGGGNIGNAAHLGGAAVGIIYALWRKRLFRR